MSIIPALTEMEAGGTEVQGHIQLHLEFDASLSNMRPWLEKTLIANISKKKKKKDGQASISS